MKTRAPHLLLAVAALLLPIRAVAADLYVSIGFDNTIVKFAPDGTPSIFANTGLSNPWGLAFDYAGNLFAANRDNSTIMKFTPGGTGSVFASAGLSNPYGLAFDSAGNLYAANQNNTIVRFSPDGVGSVFASAGLNFPTGLAFDHAGNLFVANTGNDTIQKFTPGGAGSLFASSGLSSPYGLAVDGANNLYATNSNNNTIQRFTPGGVGSVFASSGLSNPFAAVFDSAGNFYTGNYFGGAIRKFAPDGSGSTFATAPNVPHFMTFLPAPSPIVRDAGFVTPIPGGTGNFTSLPSAPGYSSSGAVAFFGAGSGGQQGVYVSMNGPPIRIADTATAIPGGTGAFTSFGDVSLSATDVAFLGFGAGGQGGIYDMTGGSLVEVIGLGAILDGRTITGLNLSRTGLSGDPVAYQATFADGSQGIYTATIVPEPGTALLFGFGALAFAGARMRQGRVRRTTARK